MVSILQYKNIILIISQLKEMNINKKLKNKPIPKIMY